MVAETGEVWLNFICLLIYFYFITTMAVTNITQNTTKYRNHIKRTEHIKEKKYIFLK